MGKALVDVYADWKVANLSLKKNLEILSTTLRDVARPFQIDWNQLGPGIIIYNPSERKGDAIRVHNQEEAQLLMNALNRIFFGSEA